MEYLAQMIHIAQKAMLNAYVPLCQFPVGVCIRTPEGVMFGGCNWENAALPLGQCAEASAIGTMLTEGYRLICEVVLMAQKSQICTPCGGCRQRLFEFSTEQTTIYYCNAEGRVKKTLALSELLPEAFR